MERIILSPSTLNCGNCSLLQISSKLHLGSSCGWYLQPTLDFNYSCPGFIPTPRASWEHGCKAGSHIWACFGTQSLLALSKLNCPECSMGGDVLSSLCQAPGQAPWATWCLLPVCLCYWGRSWRGEKSGVFFGQGWKEDNSLCWILTQLGIPAQKFTITPKSRKKVIL